MGDQLTGKVVVVAGASAGMGFAAARRCAEEGIAFVGPRPERPEFVEQLEEIKAAIVSGEITVPTAP